MEKTQEEIRKIAAEQNIRAAEWLKENFDDKQFLSNSAQPHDEDKLLSIAKAMREMKFLSN